MRINVGGLTRVGLTACWILKDLLGPIKVAKSNCRSPVLNFQTKIGRGLLIGR